VALSWIIRHPLCIAIPAALTCEEVEKNAKASDLILSSSDIKRIEGATTNVSPLIYGFDHHIVRPISWIKEAIKHLFFDELPCDSC
jgi:diketogulonate reductase-like aldo/keto reductase